MPALQYRLSTRVSNGHAEVLARFFAGREFSQRAKCRIFCPVAAWNPATQQLTIPKKITPQVAELTEAQRKLDGLRDYIFQHWWSEQYNATEGWLQQTIDDFAGINVANRKTVREVCEERFTKQSLDESTKAQYEVLLSALDRFHKGKHLYIDTIDKNFIDDFATFFKHEHIEAKNRHKIVERSQNTVVTKLRRFRAIMNYAAEKGYIDRSPFDFYKIQTEVYGDPICMTIAERDKLYQFDELSEGLKIQRDIFVFQCHIGCRVSDLMNLKKENVQDGFLQYIAHKTRKEHPTVIRIPLSDTAKEIIERYADSSKSSLLPFIHPNNYNDAIREASKLSGLDRTVIVQDPISLQPVTKKLYEVITSHVARKTFAQAMFSQTKSERITSAFTGHAQNSRAFARYAVVDDEMKIDALAHMNAQK